MIDQLLEWILNESIVNCLRQYPEICLGGEMKNYENSQSG
jgi:hypothetical protein